MSVRSHAASNLSMRIAFYCVDEFTADDESIQYISPYQKWKSKFENVFIPTVEM